MPDYIDYFTVSFTPEFVEVIVEIESCFEKVNYIEHVELLHNCFSYENSIAVRDMCDTAISIYRTHIDVCLHRQGFTLMNANDDPLPILSKILMGVTALATVDVKDILIGEVLPNAEDNVDFICNVLSIVTNIPSIQLQLYIDKVDDNVIQLIKSKENLETFQHTNSSEMQARFIRVRNGKPHSLVVNAIRQLNYFGYDPKLMLKMIENELDDLTDPVAIRSEIELLIAGSSLRDPREMLEFAEETVEKTFHDTQLMLKINSGWTNFEGFMA